VLLGYFMHKPRAQTVQVPLTYRDELEYLYTGLELDRTFEYPRSELPAEGCSQGRMNLFDMAQVARIEIDGVGPDFDAFIANLEGQAREKGMEVFQVWLPLASPCAPAATDILRRHGYFLGGMLPCWPKGDGLLMQKVSQVPDWDGIALYSERAKTIGEMIRHDWKRVAQG
jgi:hypothetical protein